MGEHHVIVIAKPDGTGTVQVFDDLYITPSSDEKRAALADALTMLSIARHLVFEEYEREGGTVDDLRTSPVKKL
jgi:hypothetical protein